MIKRKGLAQIPLMIGLLFMAVVVPVATKLVQENQDTRNQAADSCYPLNSTKCVSGKLYTCTNYAWSFSKNCVCANSYYCVVPTNTPKPPTPTSSSNTCYPLNSTKCVSGKLYTCTNYAWSFSKNCVCANSYYCVVPTNTPKPPTPTSSSNTCYPLNLTKCTGGKLYVCESYSWKFSKNCVCAADGNYCVVPTNTPKPPTATIKPIATNTPKPTATNTPKPPTATPTLQCNKNTLGKCGAAGGCKLGEICKTYDNGLSYVCRTDESCKQLPTLIPTSTPTPTLQCNKNTLGKCGAAGGCKLGEKCKTYDNGLSYVCRIDDDCKQLPTLIPTSTPTSVPGVCSKYPMPNGCNCSNGSGCSSGYCSEAGKCENPPSPSNKCPGAEACPNPSNKNLLQNCTPPDSDGTPKDTLCNEAGMIRPCGGKNYCCPTAGGAWTTDMTKCPAGNCTQCPGKPEAKLKGDADCSGITNINDASIWRSEFISSLLGKTVKNNWRADFDCDGKVTLNDISIWRDNFIKSL